MEQRYWKISDFSKLLGKHNNTIDGWFRNLETKRHLHYISRVNGEKVYDELDYEIAKFIIDRRDNKWSLNAIFDDLPNHFSLRPFPPEYEKEDNTLQVIDVETIKANIMEEIKATFEELAASQLEKQKDDFQKMLPSREQQRLERLDTIMTEHKVKRKLEKEALSIWSEKPEEERLIKAGWFKKVEDKDKREQFVSAYIDDHFEEALKKEFGIAQEDDM